VKRTRKVRVNCDNEAEKFWQGRGGFIWATFAGVGDYQDAPDELELTGVQIIRLKACPGWNDSIAPKHALHQLIVE
jgi:hypothetical protein